MPLMNVVLPLDVTWELDGMRFNAVDRYGCEWVVEEESGWAGSAVPRTQRTPKVNHHGAFRAPAYRDVRTVSLSGYCAAPTANVRRLAERRVAGLCGDPETLYTLTCHEEPGPLVTAVELDDKVQVTTLHERWFTWSIQLAAPDPRKYTVDWQDMNTGLAIDAGDGLNFAQRMPPDTNQGLWFGYPSPDSGLTFGTSNSNGFMELTNIGSAPTFPIYTLVGPLTAPTLTTVTGSMRYNAILPAGARVMIDPAVPSVLLDGTSSQRRLLNPAAFASFAIPPMNSDGSPGTLRVGLTHSGAGTATGYVQANFRSAWF